MTTAEAAPATTRPRNAARWIPFGTYYGMFPVDFALVTVSRYSEPGDTVLDPFAGRGTAVAAAAALGRDGVGIEINPVAWLYARVKLAPAPKDLVINRLKEVAALAPQYTKAMEKLPTFYRWCFAPDVRRFLLAVRENLNWRENYVDSTLAAFVLLYLHGKYGQALSNQMRQQKSMAPDYSVRWWQERNLRPSKIDIVPFLTQRIRWRYAWGELSAGRSSAILGDAVEEIPRMEHEPTPRFRLLLTSPPYHGITNYYYDHWLRYWVLGGPERPKISGERWRQESRQDDRERYKRLLQSVFKAAAKVMLPDATIYVRTDARDFTRRVTEEALRAAFPGKLLEVREAPYGQATQTALFGDTAPKPGDVDLILSCTASSSSVTPSSWRSIDP